MVDEAPAGRSCALLNVCQTDLFVSVRQEQLVGHVQDSLLQGLSFLLLHFHSFTHKYIVYCCE